MRSTALLASFAFLLLPVACTDGSPPTAPSLSPTAAVSLTGASSGLTAIDLGTLGGIISAALAVNEASQVVGDAFTATGATHAFLWENGVMTDLGTLGGSQSRAFALKISTDGRFFVRHRPSKGVGRATFRHSRSAS